MAETAAPVPARTTKLREELDLIALGLRVRMDRLRYRGGVLEDEPDAAESGGEIQVGTLLSGRYRIEALLGRGAFGKVWRATDLEEKRGVAIKELLDAPSDNAAEQFREFEQEFFTLSQLRHRHIVGALDYGRGPGGGRFLTMELVEGSDLSDRIARGPLAAAEAARILYELVLALELLHSRLLVHCDIKSENLRLTTHGVKLMDFGLLHQLGTPVTQVKGTPLYMAPEVLQGGVIDARTDFYSVGVLAYEVFTGRPPFSGATADELFRAHLETTPRAPSYYLDLPNIVDALVERLLAKEPAARPAEASEILEPLAQLAGIKRGDAETLSRTGYLYAADLVGRDTERARLAAFRTALVGGEGASIAVAGRGGEGKTRLLEELKLKVKVDGMHWLVGQCRPEFAPLQPIVDALTPLVSECSADELERYGPALSWLLPAVAERGYRFEGSPDPNLTRVMVFSAVSDWLASVSARRRVVLCLEDLHWADGATVDIYNALIQRRGTAPVGFVGTFRSNELDQSASAYSTIHDGLTRLLSLDPLTRAGTDALLACSLHEHTLSSTFVDELFAAAQGNPFFTIEALRALVETRALERVRGVWTLINTAAGLPHDINEVVARRVAVLPAELKEACEALAPIGRYLDLAPVLAVLQLPARDAHDKLTALVERQFLLRERGRYLFTHDQVRAALYSSLEEGRSRALHQRVAEALVATPGVEAATIAFHFKRGVTRERAADLFLTAAKKSLGKQQQGEAIRLLSEGLSVVDALPAKRRRVLEVTMLEIQGRISTLVQPRVGAAAVERLMEIWRSEFDVERTSARLRSGPTRWDRLAKRLRPGKAPATEFDPSSRDPRVILPKLLELRGQEAYGLTAYGEVGRAAELLEEIERLMPSPDHPIRFGILQSRALSAFHRGRFNEVRAYADEVSALVDALSAPPPPPVTFAYFVVCYLRGFAEAWAGLPISASFEQRTQKTADATKSTMFAAYAILPRFIDAIQKGDPERVEPLAAQIEVFLQRLGFPELGITRLRLALPYYYACRGNSGLAEAHGRAILHIAERGQDRWLAIYQRIFLAINAAEQAMRARVTERLEEADALLEASVAEATAADAGRVGIALAWRVDVLRAHGRSELASACAAALETRANNAATACPMLALAAVRARGTLTQGEAGDALLVEAVARAEKLGNPLEELVSTVRLAEHRVQRGGGDGCNDGLVARATSLASALRNPLWLERVNALGGQVGGPLT